MLVVGFKKIDASKFNNFKSKFNHLFSNRNSGFALLALLDLRARLSILLSDKQTKNVTLLQNKRIVARVIVKQQF